MAKNHVLIKYIDDIWKRNDELNNEIVTQVANSGDDDDDKELCKALKFAMEFGHVLANYRNYVVETDQPNSIVEYLVKSEQKSKSKRSVSGNMKKIIAWEQDWKCNICDEKLDASFEIDHVIPLKDGGSNERSNLAALCRKCHGKKNNS